MKAVQKFTDEYLEQCRGASPQQIIEFLESFRQLQGSSKAEKPKSKLISLKVQEDLLAAFRSKCEIEGLRYQTQIKILMSCWLASSD